MPIGVTRGLGVTPREEPRSVEVVISRADLDALLAGRRLPSLVLDWQQCLLVLPPSLVRVVLKVK